MNKFRGFVIKEFFHIFRDVRTMIILFGMPVMQMLLFGYVITNEIKEAKIAILDHSRDHVTTELSRRIVASSYFQLAQVLDHDKEILDVFRKGDVKEVIVFEADFAEKLEKTGQAKVQILGDASEPNTAKILVNYTTGILMSYIQELNTQTELPLRIDPVTTMLYNPQMAGVYMFVPGTIAILLMLICALMTSISITREKELGTMELLLVSPLKAFQIIVGKVLPYVFLGFINAVTILLLGNFVFGVPIQGSVILLLLESILFIIMSLSLGILISTLTNSQQIAMMVSMVALMLPTILLSGFIYPVENMPKILQYLCYIVPPKYFIIIVKNIMLKGTGMEYVWKETLIIIGFTMVFLLLSIRKFKIRLA